MKKKIVQLGRKTGLEGGEVRSFFRIGVSGFLALLISGLAGTSHGAGRLDPYESLPIPGRTKPKAREPLPEKCLQKPDGGPCKALFWKHYFDPESGECKEFVYGGCEGTVPFESREECERECLEQSAEPVHPLDDCGGPFPGYPCGSKYYTVSVRDFRHLFR
uniref:Proteinase inhibitor I4 serpin n=1 Tax=Geobacter metallireducens TaxID=28232 RepID=A0A831XGC0_GEOME